MIARFKYFVLYFLCWSFDCGGQQLEDYNELTKLVNAQRTPYYQLTQFVYPKLRLEGVTLKQTESSLAYFEMTRSQVDTVEVYGSYDNLRFHGVRSDLFQIVGDPSERPSVAGFVQDSCKFHRMVISNVELKSAVIDEVRLDAEISISNVSFQGRSNINLIAEVPQLKMCFDNVVVEGGVNIDISNARRNAILLKIDNTNFDNITLDYFAFRLIFDTADHLSYDEMNAKFHSLLASFKKNGRDDSYEKLDKEYREWRYLYQGRWYGPMFNWIDRVWWDYGYNKLLVFRASAFLMLSFFLINMLLFDKLVTDVYALKQFQEVYKKWTASASPFRFVIKGIYIFLYTSYIFWGWRLDLSEVRIHHVVLFGYVLIQYLVGVVCLAYLVNIIITI